MKSAISRYLVLFFLCLPSTTVSAAEISVDSNTFFRIEQRDLTGADKQNINTATQFIGFDAGKLADGNLSLHLYGWGRADFGDESYNSDKTDGGFTYGYLRYRFDAANADVRAGRFFVREGIVNEQVDGINFRTDLPLGFGISMFGGATVHNDDLSRESSDGKGDYLYGGRFNYRYKGMLDLGISAVYEDEAKTLLHHANGNHRLVGGDIWLTPLKWLEVIGHSSYNTETSDFAEHSYLLNLVPTRQLTVSTEFSQNKDRSYFYSWAMISGADISPDDTSTTIGTTVAYALNKSVEISGDYKHYDREAGSANRYGGNLKLKFMDNAVRTGIGYHYLNAGEAFAIGNNPSASYHEARVYAMRDTKTYFAAVDLLGYFFKDEIYDENQAVEAKLSLGYHITPNLALSGDLSFGKNPEFTEETKGLIRLTYNPVFGGKGDKK